MTNQNLPCPICGCQNMQKWELDGVLMYDHPIHEKCILEGYSFKRESWNSRPPHPLEKK